jgi:sulfur relay (sulfurtransferase) DsrF/TusC family protein
MSTMKQAIPTDKVHYQTIILITCPPYQGRRSEEILEAIMSLALFDRDHAVMFFDQGLGWLSTGQVPGDRKNLSKQLSALPMYGSDDLFYCAGHKERVLGNQPVREDVMACTLSQLTSWLRQASYVEVF